MIAGLNTTGCHKNFDTDGFYLFHDCTASTTDFFTTWRDWQGNWITWGMPVLYAIIFVKMTLDRRLIARSVGGKTRTELRFLIQSIIICVVFLVELVGFSLLPQLEVGGQWKFVLNFFTDCLVVTFNTIHSVVIFSFNVTARRELFKLLHMRPGNGSITVLPAQTTFTTARAFGVRRLTVALCQEGGGQATAGWVEGGRERRI